ncbi:MAG: FAD:protein FMN transferase [Synergistaceae bacterium]|jgi:thiamine biosynthesis lipoprotein|nr:FAD:protein FMN transferase [Synergistaceae bacterium]
MTRKLYRLVPVAFVIAALSFALHAWNGAKTASEAETRGANAGYRKFSDESFDSFDTLVTFTAFTRDEAEFGRYAKIVRDEMGRLHRLFDIYHEYEGLINLKTINDAAGIAPVQADTDIMNLLELAKEAYDDTGGAFNVALGPVLAIWHDRRAAAANGVVSAPSAEELQSAAVHISARDIRIDRENSTVFLPYGDMRLDVGAVAKGYAAQRAADMLRRSGLASGIINAGGNVVIIGPPLDGRETWSVGVHAPTDDGDMSKLLDVLYLKDGSAVTSGSDQRYFIADDRRYHHIIDPQTLFPADGLKSVTVLHNNSSLADILSTAAFILPMNEARALLARHGAEAMWMTEDGETMATEGYKRASKVEREKSAGEMKAGGEL